MEASEEVVIVAEEEKVCFLALDDETGDYIGKQIRKCDLAQFPASLLTRIAFRQLKGDYNEQLEAFIVKCTPQTLDNVAYFYSTGVWRNPHLSQDHRLEFDGVGGDFYTITQHYLNLPAIIEEPEDEQEEEEEEEEEEEYEDDYDDDYHMGGMSDDDDGDDGDYDYGDYGFPHDDREPGGIAGWEY